MGVTDNLELNTITESDNPTVAEFFQKLAGSANNSNMEIIDDEFEKYAKIDDLDSTGAVREAGGIVPYVDYVAQTESDVLVVTMTYTNGFECDVSFAQITSAYNSGKTCMLYANTGTNGGNKCVYMLGYLDGDQAIFTAVADSQLYQFRIGSDNTITFSQTSLGTVTNISDSVTTESSETAASSTAVKTAYDAAMAAVQSSEKGAANGVAPLTSDKKIDAVYLPLLTSVTANNTDTAATSSSVKTAYDKATEALNVANTALSSEGKVMTGATVSSNGSSGLVPAPTAGQDALYLRGDGTWSEVNANDKGPFIVTESCNFDLSILGVRIGDTINVVCVGGGGGGGSGCGYLGTDAGSGHGYGSGGTGGIGGTSTPHSRYYGGDGGSGYAAEKSIIVDNLIVDIVIGVGGTKATSKNTSRSDATAGGTTSFGSYLSAAGGEPGTNGVYNNSSSDKVGAKGAGGTGTKNGYINAGAFSISEDTTGITGYGSGCVMIWY